MIGGRFGRRRRTEEGRGAPIDASWLERAASALGAGALEPLELEGVAASFARVGVSAAGAERRLVVAVSPRSGGDALLAALALEGRPEASGADLVAAAPRFDAAGRRRLGALRGAVRTLELGGADSVLPELPTPVVPEECLAAPLASPLERSLFERAAAGLRGLAAKHGGATRPARGGLELVILARPVAWLRAEPARVALEILAPDRATLGLDDAGLVEALDRLEGGIRRRLADRHVRDGEEGLRGRFAVRLAEVAGLRFARRWPFSGSAQGVDLVGVDAAGTAVIGVVRERFDLAELGAALDAVLAAEPLLPLALREASGPVQIGERPRLVFAARQLDAPVEAVLARLALAHAAYRITGESLTVLGEGAPVAAPAPLREPVRPPAFTEAPRAAFTEAPRAAFTEAPRAAEEPGARLEREREPSSEERESGLGRGRRRRRRGRGRGGREGGGFAGASSEPAEPHEDEPAESESIDTFSLLGDDEPAPAARFADVVADDEVEREPEQQARGSAALEFSVFELGDEPGAGDRGEAGRPRGRRRGRGRRRRRGPGDAGESADEEEPARSEPVSAAPSEVEALDDDLEAQLELSDAPELEEVPPAPAYEDEEEGDGEPESETDRLRIERERRRRERGSTLDLAAGDAGEGVAAGEETSAPRGRAAILAHADRDSIAAAVLLARDMRQLEGIWIYPQADLMTFFRGVATDLRESTPIYVVGFAPKPSRDVLQAAALYRGRLVWFDHHAWPPEDLLAMRAALGPALVRVVPGAGSCLPAVVPFCQRRSRFTDKLVDLAGARFTIHDYQRWGRLWWWRLAELAKKRGEHRSDLELLIDGRPSDLAREAERAAAPPLPEELTWVAGRDFRIVHFGGLGLAVVETPPELDLGLAMRLVRERYGLPLSLGRKHGQEAIVLGAEEATSRRGFDLGAMVQHLAEKFAWVDALPDDDHVARLRAHDIEARPERLEELLAELGMSRALLEG